MTKKYLSSIRPNGIYEEPKLNNKCLQVRKYIVEN
jgi:hypothetical protein